MPPRRLALPGGETVFATDTVGFVRKLPHQLVTAFKTTLDVVRDADLLVHVVDGNGHDPVGSMDAVREVLEEIEQVMCLSSSSSTRPTKATVPKRLAEKYEGSVAVSAHSGFNLEHLTAVIGDRVRSMTALAELMIPWDRGDVLASVHREGQVLSERAEEHGMRLKARLEPASLGHLHEYVLTVDGEVPSQQRHEEDEW